MMKLLFVVCILSLSLSIRGDVNNTQANLGIGFSTESLDQVLNVLILPVVDLTIAGIGQTLPQDCCWHNPDSYTRLYLQDLIIPDSSVQSFGSISATSDGLFFETFLQFDLTFYYHLCEEVGITCTSLSLCNGNATLKANINLKFQLIFNAGPEGHLVVTFDSFDLHFSFPSKKGLCFVLSGLIDAATPIVNALLDKLVPEYLGHLLSEINGVNQTKPLPFVPFAINWAFTNDTGTSIDGLGFQLIINLLLNRSGYQPAPFLPNPPLPGVLTLMQQEEVFFEMSDALLNNILYTVFPANGITLLDTEAKGFDISIHVEDPPVVSFLAPMSQDDAAQMFLETKVVATKKFLRFSAQASVTLHFEIIVTPQGELYLDVDPDEFEVEIKSATPPLTNATKTMIEKEIENAWASHIPELDEQLRNNSIQLPHFAYFNTPQIIYNQGYVSVSVNTLPAAGEKDEFTNSMQKTIEETVQRIWLRTWKGGRELEEGEFEGLKDNLGCPQINPVGFEEGCPN